MSHSRLWPEAIHNLSEGLAARSWCACLNAKKLLYANKPPRAQSAGAGNFGSFLFEQRNPRRSEKLSRRPSRLPGQFGTGRGIPCNNKGCIGWTTIHFPAVVRFPQGLVQVRLVKHFPEPSYHRPISRRLIGNNPLDRSQGKREKCVATALQRRPYGLRTDEFAESHHRRGVAKVLRCG